MSQNEIRRKILLSSYAARPGAGSELGIGWNTIVGLSKRHEVWAMVAEEFRPEIEKSIQQTPIPNVHWVFYDFTRLFMSRRDNELIRRLHYYLWQQRAYEAAKPLVDQIGFDASVHVTYGSYWRPSFLARLPIPFLWGPMGGAENTPLHWYRYLDVKTLIWESQKLLFEKFAFYLDPSVRSTAQKARMALVGTRTTGDRVRQLGARDVRIMPQARLPLHEIEALGKLPPKTPSEEVIFFSSGRIIGWKGIQFAVRAFARMLKDYPDAKYWHVGDGTLAGEIRALAGEFGISDKFQIFEGKTRKENFEYMAQADVFVFPCLHDEPGVAVLEAMSAAKPLVFLRGRPYTPNAEKYGFIARYDTMEHAVEDMAAAMLRLARDPELRRQMGEAGREEVRAHMSFESSLDKLSELFDEVAPAR